MLFYRYRRRKNWCRSLYKQCFSLARTTLFLFTVIVLTFLNAYLQEAQAKTKIALGTIGPGEVRFDGADELGIWANVYEPLIVQKTDGLFYGALSQNFEMVEPKVVRFHLRENAKFSDGSDRVMDGAIASLKKAVASGGLPDVEAIDRIDQYNLDITFQDGVSNPLSQVARIPIFPENFITNSRGAVIFGEVPGTGPFTMGKYVRDVSLTLSPNVHWWGAESNPWRRDIVVYPIWEYETRAAAAIAGEFDYSELSVEGRIRVASQSSHLKFQVVETDIVTAAFFGGNEETDFERLCVRQKLAGLINRYKSRPERHLTFTESLEFPTINGKRTFEASWSNQSLMNSNCDIDLGKVVVFGPQRHSKLMVDAIEKFGGKARILPYSAVNNFRHNAPENWIYVRNIRQSRGISKLRLGASAFGRFKPLSAWVNSNKSDVNALLENALIVPIAKFEYHWAVSNSECETVRSCRPSLFYHGAIDLASFGRPNEWRGQGFNEERVAGSDECNDCGAGSVCYEKTDGSGCECDKEDSSRTQCDKT